jgi:hypothetical protein
MIDSPSVHISSERRTSARNPDIRPTTVLPFGRYGVGLFTEHPVGLVVAIGIILLGLEAMPEARWFLGGSVALGALIGFFLWLHHRTKSFD